MTPPPQTQQQWVTPLQAALTAAGVSIPDGDCLASSYPNVDVTEFLAGLDWLAQLYDANQIPSAPLPTCDPWAYIATQMAQSTPGDFDLTFATAVANKPPALQNALVNAVFSRAQYLAAQQITTPSKKPSSAQLVQFLAKQGYTFRLNEADDSLEVNGVPMTDAKRAEIRACLRDHNYVRYLEAAEDAYLAEAARHGYHPVREYLNGLQYDGAPHIERLAKHFTDTHNVFGDYLRKWLIGAVARAFTGCQNRVLLLESKQGLGKSQFAKWLCPLPAYFTEDPLNPDDKDSQLHALRYWIWELSEIEAVTRRSDMAALKSFLSRQVFQVRPPYGRYEVKKPGLCSFIGTANDSSGLIGDPTGSRRYLITTLEHIDWSYTQLNVAQVWAEANAAYLTGEDWNLTGDEARQAEELNAQYRFVDPVELLFNRLYPFSDPDDKTCWITTAEILITMQASGLGQNATANAMKLAATLKHLGYEKAKQGKQNGYFGIR